MKSIFLMLVVLTVSTAIAEDRNLCTEGQVQEQGQLCYPKALVEKWNKHIKTRKPTPTPSPIVIERKVIVEKEVRVEPKKNALSLVAGRSETNLQASGSYPMLQAKTAGQFDAGLMYQRELGKSWRASIIGTKNGGAYGAIGYEFNLFGE